MLTSDAINIDHEYARKAYGICVHHHYTGDPGCIGALRALFQEYRSHQGTQKPLTAQGFCKEIKPEVGHQISA